MKPKTFEFVTYDDGTSALSEFDRGTPENESQLVYIGRAFYDERETAVILDFLSHPRVYIAPRVMSEVPDAQV